MNSDDMAIQLTIPSTLNPDGDELIDYFGTGIVECEDVLFFKEWKNPFADSGTVRVKDPIFISQTGVTLTSTYNYRDTEGTRSSYITVPYRAPATGSFKLKITPNSDVAIVTDTLWFPQYITNSASLTNETSTSVGGYSPVELRGDDVVGIGDQDFINETLQKAINVTVKASGGAIQIPTNETYDPVVERISRGVLVGVGESAGKGTIFASMGYKGKFEFVKNVNYEITISVDLGRLSDYTPADSDPFTDLAMLRLLNLDFIRVEKQSLNPLTTDADGDGLTDGEESGWDGYPNTNDADRDGLTDSQELTAGTSPMKRDTDGDGVRDGVELGKTSQFFIGQGTPNETFGSWTERLARSGTPFSYDFIPH